MSQITAILDSIFQNNGGTTKEWRKANGILLTRTDEAKKYVAYMKNKIRDLNKDTQLLALDFLDYSIDDGKMPLWTQVGSKDFLSTLVNIYKTRNEEEVQKKILFLIKKWANKFQKYNTIIPNYTTTYENLKNNDVEFPRDAGSTYDKYLQGPGIQSGFGGDFSENSKPNTKEHKHKSKNRNYVKDIDVDLRPTSYEKKYKRLVNKLDDWTQQIQEANVYMDKAKDGDFNDDLRGICNDLKEGKTLLVDTIESGKLKDEKLMQISLNVQDDIESTLKRWEDVKNGRTPEPFKSSFFSNRENNKSNQNNNQNDNNNSNTNTSANVNQNKGGFDLLGFDNDFGGGNNNNFGSGSNNNSNMNTNNNNNLGNDLLDIFSSPQNPAPNQGNNNNNFNNLGNNNNNFFGGNNNNNQNNNNILFGNNNTNNQTNSNDLFSQAFGNNNNVNSGNNNLLNFNNNNNSNNNSNNSMNTNNIFDNIIFQNNNTNNNLNNNQFLNLSSNNSNNNFMNFNNNNNNFGFGNNNANNFGSINNLNSNQKNVSNQDFNFNF